MYILVILMDFLIVVSLNVRLDLVASLMMRIS